MRRCLLISLFFLSACINKIHAQCTTLGQNPATAFPVCGTTVFQQSVVPICSTDNLYVPGCTPSPATNYANKNPFWYRFTCFQTGTLGFTIVPNVMSDDYDWQLYDMTGHSPDEVYTNHSLVVTGNWSATPGNTGASANGANYVQCASDPADNAPTFARMPTIQQGHNYLLLVSHFTNTQSGYALSFGGGTASITDPKLPKLDTTSAPCDGSMIIVNLNKRMKCNSISSGEFSIEPELATVTAVTGNDCSSSFDMGQLTLSLSNPIPPGNYLVRIKHGSDGNTLLDNCDREIPENDSIGLVIKPVLPTPMDSITKPGCSPQTLELVFKKRIRCNTIAANGSDFIVTDGPYPVQVIGASAECVDGLSYKINVLLESPLQTAGTFKISLIAGSDDNTIIDECGQESLPSSLFFSVKDTVNADFQSVIKFGCKLDTVQYSHDGNHEVNSWLWNFDDLFSTSEQNPSVSYNTFGLHDVSLIVSNGVCSDTVSQKIFLRNTLNAKFDATMLVCPGDPATFKDLSEQASPGNDIVSWTWNFANGHTSNLQNPPQQFYEFHSADYYAPVSLVVQDFIGCKDTTVLNLNILHNCFIAVPSAFTPNNDGLNDYLYPLNAYKAADVKFSVYNRFGQRIFFTNDWTKKWDGKFKGQDCDPGTYVWILEYYNMKSYQPVFQKGTTVLIR